MPGKYATQPHWRQRKHAIGKKAALEAEMIFESEIIPVENSKFDVTPSSPVSVTSMFDMPEIKPIVLPGAWTTIGKGGRPVRGEQKMYDEPKKKKRKRNRRPKQVDDEEKGSIAKYEEMPSSSSCLVTLSRSMLKHEKAVEAKHQAKHWAKYHQEKEMKRLARDKLVAALATLGDDDSTNDIPSPYQVGSLPKQWQLALRNDRAERTRRKVRLAKAAARCYFEPDDDAPAESMPTCATKISATSARFPSTKSATDSAQATVVIEDANAETKGKASKVEKGKAGRRMSGGKNCSVM